MHLQCLAGRSVALFSGSIEFNMFTPLSYLIVQSEINSSHLNNPSTEQQGRQTISNQCYGWDSSIVKLCNSRGIFQTASAGLILASGGQRKLKDEIEALRCSGEKTVACTILLEECNCTKKKKKKISKQQLLKCALRQLLVTFIVSGSYQRHFNPHTSVMELKQHPPCVWNHADLQIRHCFKTGHLPPGILLESQQQCSDSS